jgi:hypothetical protein
LPVIQIRRAGGALCSGRRRLVDIGGGQPVWLPDGAGIKMRLLKTRSVRINNRNYCDFSGLLARISGKLFFGDQGSLMA